MAEMTLDALGLSALLCSRVCHDVVGPVGAICNGLEVLEDEQDEEMRDVALDLIRRSAKSASARLQFSRLAFGAAGSAGAQIVMSEAEGIARALVNADRVTLNWSNTVATAPKGKVKLMLNLFLIANDAAARGGVIEVTPKGEGEAMEIKIFVKGPYVKLKAGMSELLSGAPGGAHGGAIDAHSIQPFYTGLLARESGMELEVQAFEGEISLIARLLPKATGVEPSATNESWSQGALPPESAHD